MDWACIIFIIIAAVLLAAAARWVYNTGYDHGWEDCVDRFLDQNQIRFPADVDDGEDYRG